MTSASRSESRAFPTAPASSIPAVTAEQMREVDRAAVEELDLLLIQMMENAGVHLAEVTLRRFRPEAVAVLCGPGGNGGGGLVAARHLANRGVRVAVTLGEDRSRQRGRDQRVGDELGVLLGRALGPLG